MFKFMIHAFYIRVFIVLICLFYFSSYVNADDNTEYVMITVNGTGTSKNAAIKDALRIALEKASGVNIVSNSVVTNGELLVDKTVSYSSGYIESYIVLSEIIEQDLISIEIEAKVVKLNPSDIDSKNNIVNLTKELKEERNKNLNSFDRLIKLELPKYSECFERSVSTDLSNIIVNDTLKLNISIKMDVIVFDKCMENLNQFFRKVGFVENEDIENNKISLNYSNGIIVNLLPPSSSEFLILKSFFEELDKKNKYLAVALINDNTVLDNVYFERYKNPVKIDNTTIIISNNNITDSKEISIIYSDKFLTKVNKLETTVTVKKGKGYTLGIIGSNSSKADPGVKVISISKKIIAKGLGIYDNDIIKMINKIPINSIDELRTILNNSISSLFLVTVKRGDSIIDIELELPRRTTISDEI